MELTFKLMPELRECLLNHVSANEGIYGVLLRATEVKERELLLACQENEALRLLHIAKQYCPMAAPHIMIGIVNARLSKINVP
ncbi:MAG TPA: hypothetical protein VGR30_10145 [Candidatus Binatia bacterium]|nr:hypothetical protein [Candidatus Binatia bacterium]